MVKPVKNPLLLFSFSLKGFLLLILISKRHITEKHFIVIVTMLKELIKQK